MGQAPGSADSARMTFINPNRLEEGHPSCLAPGKPPRSTLSPTMALRDGESYLAWGTPGGDQ
jgi:gamma-glutamyltranspeptidase